MITKNELSKLQYEKLNLAAHILKNTAKLFNGNTALLSLWGGGVITHGIPKVKKCIIGITEAAKKEKDKKKVTKDHLFRVTETAKFLINAINHNNIEIEEIENILLKRSALMITTRNENNKNLKDALDQCKNKDNWKELYKIAGIKYELY
jgi:hypothetical protein